MQAPAKPSNQWQVVGKAKPKAKADPKIVGGQSSTKQASVAVDPAFAVLDRAWQEAKKRAEQSDDTTEAIPDSGSDADQPVTHDTPTKKPKKQRPPKPKKPKIAEVAAQITSDGSMAASLATIATKYSVDAAARAEALANYMQQTFQPCELAFNKLLLADPRHAATEPQRHLGQDAAAPVVALLQGIPLADAGVLAIALLDAIVHGQPDTLQAGGPAPPKAQV